MQMLASVPLLALFALPAATQTFEFADISATSGLSIRLQGGGPGCGVGDYDGDGWIDVAVCGGIDERPQIYRNRGAAITAGAGGPWFQNVTKHVLPATTVPSSLAMFADLDNDRDLDLLVVRRFVDPATGLYDELRTGLMAFENKNGVFHDVGTPETLGYAPRKNGGLALADCDDDGDLDIAFVHSGPGTIATGGGPGFYIRNDGIANLVDATTEFGAGIAGPRRYFSVVFADFNLDGQIDMHAAVDTQTDFHCHRAAPGAFIDVTQQVGANNPGSDMGLAVGDIENDGDLDIYSTNIDQGVLYVNDGQGNFTDEAFLRGVGSWPALPIGWGTAFVDFDHDGDQDLVFIAGQNPGLIYANDGQGYFTNVTQGSNLNLLGNGLLPFDFDNDGDYDLLAWRSGQSPISVYENRTSSLAGRHWLRVKPVGKTTNKDGVGAVVRVQSGGKTQMRSILAGYSFKAGPPMEAHFGLGDSSVADVVEIRWPSGQTQTLTNVAVDRLLQVVEPQ